MSPARESENSRAVDDLYLGLFSRLPTDPDRQVAVEYLSKAGDSAARRTALEDLAWTMLNSLEFVFNH